jgi:DNA-binding IclR family transcriptional regulator
VGTFSPEPPDDEAAAAFRAAWDRAGAGPIAGQATVRRLDGTLQRVRYVIASREDGRFEAILEPITADAKARPTAFVIGQVLTAWREAERRLERLDPGSSESRAVEAEIDELREQYQDLFQAKRSA